MTYRRVNCQAWGKPLEYSFAQLLISEAKRPENLDGFEQIGFTAVVWADQDVEIAEINYAIYQVLITINSDLLKFHNYVLE
jgi:hypothetical protein